MGVAMWSDEPDDEPGRTGHCVNSPYRHQRLVAADALVPAGAAYHVGKPICSDCLIGIADATYDAVHHWRLTALEYLSGRRESTPRFHDISSGAEFVHWSKSAIQSAGLLLDTAYGLTPKRGRRPTRLGRS